MKKKITSGILLALLSVGLLTFTSNIQPVKVQPRTWTVDDDGGADFTRIQDAINAAEPGDTIYVYNGTYYEHVIVNKTVSLVGENRSSTIIDGSRTGHVVTISAQNVTVIGFTVQNGGLAGILGYSGIRLDHAHNCTISNNFVAYSNQWAINLTYSSNNLIRGNMLSESTYGIFLQKNSHNNTIAGNLIKDNGQGAVVLGNDSGDNVITNNTYLNNEFGLWLNSASGNILRNNNMIGNRYGFGVWGEDLWDFIQDIDTSNMINGKPTYYLTNQRDVKVDPLTHPEIGYLGLINSTNVTVKNLALTGNIDGLLLAYTNNSRMENTTISNNHCSFHMVNSNGNTVTENRITNGDRGIWLRGTTWPYSHVCNNLIIENYITGHTGSGFFVWNTKDNVICGNFVLNNSHGVYLASWQANDNIIYHNNFVNNTEQVYFGLTWDLANTWDDGYPSGGNYWSDFADEDLWSGSHQNETGSDGVWDHPYVIDENNQDNYPLVHPWGSSIGQVYSFVRDINSMAHWERVEDSLVGLLEDTVYFLEKDYRFPAIITMYRFMFRVYMYRWFGMLTTEQASHMITRAMEIIYIIWSGNRIY